MKKSADIFRQNAGQLIFFVFGHFDQKTKNEKWNEPNINWNLEMTGI